MSLADELGWTERTGYVPAAFAVTAFALGVQIALVTEALGTTGYPPPGKATLAWTSAAVLAVSALVHVPWRQLGERLDEAAGTGIPRRSVHLSPVHQPSPAPSTPTSSVNGHERTGEANLRARVHSPLSAGPVVEPGEALPLVVEAEPEELARELEVTLSIRGPDGSRTVHEAMTGTRLEHEETFEELGPFTIRVEVDHPRSEPVAKTLQGRVASYDEEIGRLFEQLKDAASQAGLEVAAGSTPREVCRELRSLADADPSQLADLAVELEVALYGDEAVDRATYETVYAAIAATGLLDEAPAQEVQR